MTAWFGKSIEQKRPLIQCFCKGSLRQAELAEAFKSLNPDNGDYVKYRIPNGTNTKFTKTKPTPKNQKNKLNGPPIEIKTTLRKEVPQGGRRRVVMKPNFNTDISL